MRRPHKRDEKSSFFSTFVRALFANDLSREEAASTLFRFFRSDHIKEIRFLVYGTVFLFAAYTLTVIVAMDSATVAKYLNFIKSQELQTAPPIQKAGNSEWVEWVKTLITLLGPALGVTGVMIAWGYRSASARLGVVDLFAGEIGTLCRVGTVFDVGRRYTSMFRDPPKKATLSSTGHGGFVSEEHYFPVFDTNARDLQLLEAIVVNHITEFYTYMKASRDLLRKLSVTAPPIKPKGRSRHSEDGPDTWRATLIDLIFTLFLGYESARKAIESLVEFEPDAAEHTMIILITELQCYAFLLDRFGPHDVHHHLHLKRLLLRVEGYRDEIDSLRRRVKSRHGKNDKDWIQAMETLPALIRVYKEQVAKSVAAVRCRCKDILD